MARSDIVRRLTGSLREDGLRASLQKVVRIAREPLFDLRHRTDTSGHMQPSMLGLSGPNAGHAVEYVPTGYHDLSTLFKRLDLPTDGAFLDLGCGKGRVLLMASRLGFTRLVGVELSPRLCEVARRNVARFDRATDSHIEIVNDDATQYVLRDDEVVVFLFNPFDEPVVKAVLGHITESLRRRPRQLSVIYYHARCRDLLDRSEYLVKAAEHPMRHHHALIYTTRPEFVARERLPQ